jgi:predicted transcriptional regulator of viral defense system
MAQAKTSRILELVRRAGVLRPRDLDAHHIPRQYLRLAQQLGLVTRIGRGLYIAADSEATENHTIAEASKRVPHGTVCLLSALRFHELTTQIPSQVWLAIDQKARLPKVDYPPLRIVRFSGESLTFGLQTRQIEKVSIRVFNPAKTVADCFKYRNKIGLDVALEALRESRRRRKATIDELWKAAKVCRVANVMRPYMESLS